MALKKVGLLGGSFDPIHLAHIALADAAHHDAGLSTVELVPAANPWQRAPLAATTKQRLDMLRLAIGRRSYVSINLIEVTRGGKTYTLDTVKELPAATDYYWILGSDQLANFCSWHGWRDIALCVHLMVARRPGAAPAPPVPLARHLARHGLQLFELPFPEMAISASEIRRRLAADEPVEGMLDAAVAQYIKDNQLYRAAT
ncbi:MAG: nicotinate (nicotinamide) nucleotide adenylyltransferase [Candidimonas sp.]|nr:MAG: nicotinate (nicotinamide) nucleotide adenylyltransferase [Candidimonas sp.]